MRDCSADPETANCQAVEKASWQGKWWLLRAKTTLSWQPARNGSSWPYNYEELNSANDCWVWKRTQPQMKSQLRPKFYFQSGKTLRRKPSLSIICISIYLIWLLLYPLNLMNHNFLQSSKILSQKLNLSSNVASAVFSLFFWNSD